MWSQTTLVNRLNFSSSKPEFYKTKYSGVRDNRKSFPFFILDKLKRNRLLFTISNLKVVFTEQFRLSIKFLPWSDCWIAWKNVYKRKWNVNFLNIPHSSKTNVIMAGVGNKFRRGVVTEYSATAAACYSFIFWSPLSLTRHW